MSSKESTLVEFYYDLKSPYSYIAFEIISQYKKEWKSMNLKYCPFFLGAVMQATGNNTPAALPARAKYLGLDLARNGEFYNIPLQPPKDFFALIKTGTLKPTRLLVLVGKLKGEERMVELSRAFYKRVWIKGTDICDDQTITEICMECGFNKEEVDNFLKHIEDPEIKEAVKEQTDKAIAKGAFGAPNFIVYLKDGPQLIFGSDRMHFLANFLGEEWKGNQIMPKNKL